MENELTLNDYRFTERTGINTQADLRQLIGVSNTTADIERGRTKLLVKWSLELLKQFKIKFRFWLFGRKSEENSYLGNVRELV